MNETKNYGPYQILANNSSEANTSESPSSKTETDPAISFENQTFAEIEFINDVKTSCKPVPIPQKIEPVMDEKRRKFASMREISRYNHSSYFVNSKFYHKQAQYENSKIFYKQAVFMKDFEDDYTETAPFSSYFPYYQLMNYEQLRTYFTWRTRVRSGDVQNASLSYAFVYIYELLNQIGVSDAADGLDKLMFFWNSFKVFDSTVEKYLIKWVKDYHVYYNPPGSFKEFLCKTGLESHYPEIVGYEPEKNCFFEQLCGVSKYNIKQSAFYSDETSGLISDCFDFVMGKLKSSFSDAGMELHHLIFQPSKSKSVWTPFCGALFYPTLKQTDRQVVLSENEIYSCCQNRWLHSTVITVESGRQLVGYIFKQMEAVLRQTTKYKYKLSANMNMVGGELLQKLGIARISLEKEITNAVLEFYKESTKTVVSVDQSLLEKIRLEALDTQEKLIVPEGDHVPASVLVSVAPPVDKSPQESVCFPPNEPELSGGWVGFKNALNEIEINALAEVLQGDRDLRLFADENGVMLEVLADSINEKAFDYIGDNVLELDDSMKIYNEYKEKIMIMVR